MRKKKYRFGPVSTEWKGFWKSSRADPDVAQEAYTLASEFLSTLISGFDGSPYVRGDFFGDRTLYLEAASISKVTSGLLKRVRHWLASHPQWRVVIPVGTHEEAFILYRNATFRGLEQLE